MVKYCIVVKIIVNEIFYYSEISLDSLKCKFKLIINDIDKAPTGYNIQLWKLSLFTVYNS